MAKKRIIYGGITLCLLVIIMLIALYVHDDFIRPYGGDVLVVVLIYFIIRTIIVDKAPLLPLYVFLFACFTEFMQYINIVELLGLQDNRVISIAVGSVFDWADVLSYGVGCFLMGGYELILHRNNSNNGYDTKDNDENLSMK